MIVGIVGPKDMVERTHKIIQEESRNTVITDLVYENYKETPAIVEKNQENVDAIIFVGKIPYKYAEKYIKQKVPWEYIPRDISAILSALLEASMVMDCDIKNISVDTYPQEIINEALEEIGVQKDKFHIYVAEQRLLDEEYIKYTVDFHSRNYYVNGVSCCITGITNVFNKLKEKNIPCIRSLSLKRVILTTFSQLKLKYLVKENQNSQIVAIAISIDALNPYSVVAKDEYEYMLNKMKITGVIYLFAAKIEAAVSEITNKEFLLFTTRKMLEVETNNYNNFYLMEMVENKTFYTISVGVGYGETANKAKFNALYGMNKSIEAGGNLACVVYNENNIHRVIRNREKETRNNIDNILDAISKKTNISPKILYRIYSVVEKNELDTFTASELAKLCGINYRSINRIIQKLESSGYCTIVGERIIKDRGRPSRILKLNYFV